MEVIIMTNGQNGLSGFERNGNLTCNCSWKQHSSCGPLNSWRRPIFGVPLKSKRGKESDNRLVGGGGVIEKELEFKPSFGEYLKVMESVRTGRENNQGKAFEEENIGSGVNKMNGGIVRNRSQADKITDKRYVQKNRLSRRSDQAFLERGYGEDFEVERAAFKSFEQSNDVIGKTKVPMWKKEEKIQKLGNC
ncbi:hypothetical protein D5086_003880 [Populus alba]|uniref:Uncharacterized protein n=1 Tax=Populus alba TaxID=43335 RepID=A0ACC4D5Y6_POPAL